MSILLKVLAGVGALSVLAFIAMAVFLSYIAWKEQREQELKEFVAMIIRYNPYLSSKLDTLELKQIRQGASLAIHNNLHTYEPLQVPGN